MLLSVLSTQNGQDVQNQQKVRLSGWGRLTLIGLPLQLGLRKASRAPTYAAVVPVL